MIPAPAGLVCNHLDNPLGVETPAPRLSWRMEGDLRGLRQTAYRILVATSPNLLDEETGDLWDSGKVESDRTLHVPYEGAQLLSRQACHWRVMVWDEDGQPSPWSATALWEMGLLAESDWRAQWIGPHRGYDVRGANVPPAPLFRKPFGLEKPVRRARVYLSGLGYHELYVNGERLGDEQLSPAVTLYDRAVHYVTWDVTEHLRDGENALGVVLGTGWYNCHTEEVWQFHDAPWRADVKMRLQLHLDYEDGSEALVVSDPSWRWAEAPIVFDGLRNGETYDARKEMPGWAAPGFEALDWNETGVVRAPGGIMRSMQMPPIRITQTLRPVGLEEVRPGVWVYDLGQNMAGWARLTVAGPAGTEVTLRYAEKRKDDGDIDPSNIDCFIKSGNCQTDRYILKGEGTETWEPRFTYHGFQYVQVTGFPGTPTLDSLEGRVVHTDLPERGRFECSNELLNRIQTLTRWSTLGNYHHVPTDCPHREKNGWTGDAQLSAEQVLLNFAPATAYAKWMADHRDVQRPSGQWPGIIPTGGWGFNWGSGPAWDSSGILIPWYVYLYTGDDAILSDHFEAMAKYVRFEAGMATDHIVAFGLGDWCPPEGGAGGHACPATLTDTAYFYVHALTVARAAEILGLEEEAAEFGALAARVRKAWRSRFFDPDTGTVESDCQTAYGCALFQGLIDDAETPRVLAKLADAVEKTNRHIDCGILGSKYVMNALAEYGRTDLAYAMATQTTFPSWGHWIEQGATTLWESWKGESSRNHHMFGDISAWFYKALGGLNPDPEAPGFARAILRPNPVDGLDWVKALHETLVGIYACEWKREGDAFELLVTIPPNASATVLLPAADADSATESGAPVAEAEGVRVEGFADSRLRLSVAAGTYRFGTRLG